MDPSRIELEATRCKRVVLPLDYGPFKGFNLKWLLILSVIVIYDVDGELFMYSPSILHCFRNTKYNGGSELNVDLLFRYVENVMFLSTFKNSLKNS